MASTYPGTLDTFATTSPTNLGDDDAQARNHAERHDNIGDAMNKVQTELGVDPAGQAATVANNIAAKTYALTANVDEFLTQSTWYQSGFIPTLNRLFAVPISVPAPMTVDAIQFYLQTAEASSFIRTGIYLNDPATDRPGALVVDAGQVDTSTGSSYTLATFTGEALTAGLYWVAVVAQGASSALRIWAGAASWRVPSTTGITSNLAKYVDGVSGALPDPFGTPGTGGITSQPNLAIRRSA